MDWKYDEDEHLWTPKVGDYVYKFGFDYDDDENLIEIKDDIEIEGTLQNPGDYFRAHWGKLVCDVDGDIPIMAERDCDAFDVEFSEGYFLASYQHAKAIKHVCIKIDGEGDDNGDEVEVVFHRPKKKDHEEDEQEDEQEANDEAETKEPDIDAQMKQLMEEVEKLKKMKEDRKRQNSGAMPPKKRPKTQ